MKRYFVIKDFDVEMDKGEKGIFQVLRILDEQKNDLSGKVGSGLFFKDDNELTVYLKESLMLPAAERIEIINDQERPGL